MAIDEGGSRLRSVFLYTFFAEYTWTSVLVVSGHCPPVGMVHEDHCRMSLQLVDGVQPSNIPKTQDKGHAVGKAWSVLDDSQDLRAAKVGSGC